MTSPFLRLALAALAPLAFAVAPVQAQEATAAPKQVCKKRNELVQVLAEKFGETQQSFGLQNDTRVLEVFASKTGSWTAVVTMANGKSCIVASGQAWSASPILVGQPV